MKLMALATSNLSDFFINLFTSLILLNFHKFLKQILELFQKILQFHHQPISNFLGQSSDYVSRRESGIVRSKGQASYPITNHHEDEEDHSYQT